jgi:TP901 family phage tail tape measure protein
MGRDDLKIIIQGTLDVKSTTEEINKQLKGLKLDNLNLKVNIDTGLLKEISSNLKEIQSQFSKQLSLNVNTGHLDKVTEVFKSATGEALKLTQKVTEYTNAAGQSVKVIESLNKETQKVEHTTEIITENLKAHRKEAEKLAEAMAKGRERSGQRQKNEELRDIQERAKWANKAIEDRKKLEQDYEQWWLKALKNREIKEANQAQKEQDQVKKSAQAYIDWWSKALKEREIQEEKAFAKQQDRASKALNDRSQGALNLGNKISFLSSDDADTKKLQDRLNRYQQVIQRFQEKLKLGIEVSDNDLIKLKNAENSIKRLYETVKNNQGIDFTKYDKLDDVIRKTTDANYYLNKSLIEGKKLLDANVQATEQYIKVSQRLRDGSQIQNLSVYINRATGETYKLSEAQKDLMRRTWDLGSAFKTAFEKIGLWAGATGIFYGLINSLQALGEAIVDIDTKLTELSKVLSSNTNFDELMQDTVSLANTYGRSLTEAQDALIEFGKAGYEAEQALQLTNATLLGANVTGLKTGQMAEYLTGALIQFNLTAEDSTRVIDKLNEVDNNFSVTSLGLAQSIAKAGESAQQFGVSIDELIGMTTAIAQATRESGNVIGNSLKTVFARLNMEKTQEALAGIGVAVKDVNGELRSATSIYADVASRWNTLTRAQKTYVAEALAGKYHITRMMALIENWDTVMQAAATSQNSLGSSMEENRKHMQSLESAINQVKAAGQELAYTIGELGLRDAMYSTLTVTATFTKGLTEILKSSNLATVSITALTVAFSTLGAVLIGTFVKGMATAVPALANLAAGFTAGTAAVRAFTASLLTNPIFLVATAITAIGTALVYTIGKQKEFREEFDKLKKAAEESNNKLKEIENTLSVLGSTKKQDILDYDKTIENLEKVKNGLDKLVEAEQEYINHAKELDPNFSLFDVKLDPDKVSQELKDLAQSAGVNILQFETLGEAIQAVNQKMTAMQKTSQKLKENDWTSIIEKESEKIRILTTLLDDQRAGRELNYEQLKRLKELGINYNQIIDEQNGKYTLLIKKTEELTKATRMAVENRIATLQNEVKAEEEALLKFLLSYDLKINKLEEFSAVSGEFNKKLNDQVSQGKMSADAARFAGSAISRSVGSTLNLKEQLNEYKLLFKSLSSPGILSDSSSSSSKAKSNASSTKNEYIALSKEAKRLLEIETELATIQQKKEQFPKYTKEYRAELTKEINLTKEQISLNEKLLKQTNSSNKSSAQKSDEAFKKAQELKQTISSLQTELSNLSFEYASSLIEEYGNQIDYLDDRLKLVQERLSSYPETSQKYRDTLEEEILHLKEKQELYHQEAEMIRDQLSKGKLTIAQREELNKKILELQASWLNLQNTIDDKKLQKINSLLNEQKEKTDELSKVIELSKAKMDAISDKTSQQYLDEYQSYLQLIQLKDQSLQREIQLREQLIQQNIQNIELVKKLKNEIVDLQIEQLRLKQVFEESTAGNIVDLYKSVYEEQKKVALQALDDEIEAENKRHDEKIKHLEDELKKKEKTTQKEIEAIEKQIEAEEERHDKVIKGLDDELERYREVINMRLKSIDREVSEKEYNDEMEQLQKERQRIQEQINVLMLDDSYEAKLRISELNEQLAEKDKQIEDLAYKRGVELRKDNLQDALEKYEKEVDEKKKAENEKFNETKKQLENEKKKLDEQLKYYKEYIDKQIEKEKEKHEKIIDNLNKEKEATQRHYEQLLADEKRFADLRRAILSGNLNAIQGDLNTFASFIQSNMSKIGQSIANNLLAKIEEAKRAISQLNNVSLPSYGGGSSSGSSSGSGNGSSGGDIFKSEWKNYKKQVNEIVYAKGKWKDAQEANDQKGMQYWADRAKPYYAQLPSDLAALLTSMNYERAYSWYKGHFHVGGIVGGKSDRLTELVNKMFNLKPNEGIAKVLEGELFTTPRNIAQNFIPNLQRLISNITPVVQVNGGTVAGGTGDIVFNLNIERFTGTQADYDKLANYVMDKIMLANKKRGR